MAIGMYLMHHQFGYSYGQPEMVNVIFWVEILLTVVAVVGAAKFFSLSYVGFTRPDYTALKWMIPNIFLLFSMLVFFFLGVLEKGISEEQLNLLLLGGVTTLLVGLSEEVIFRGVLLHYFARNKNIIIGIIISTVLFGSLHLVNVFGGLEMSQAWIQFGTAAFSGLFFALIILKIKSILPLIIYHWLWDFVLISGKEFSPYIPLISLVSMGVSAILIITLLINMRGELRKKLI
jgi:membrane protease YdiL (CAAX protease family)